MIADPDNTYPELMAERFGRLADLARERYRRPLPPPPRQHRRLVLLADDETREIE